MSLLSITNLFLRNAAVQLPASRSEVHPDCAYYKQPVEFVIPEVHTGTATLTSFQLPELAWMVSMSTYKTGLSAF